LSVFERERLPNGVRLVTARLDGAQTTACFLMFGAGSRYERAETGGMAHFVEHMLFKGTSRRPSMRDITGEIDAIGARMNASTGKDCTYYWVKASPERASTALDVLADMVRHSLFEPDEIERERSVIAEEIKMDRDRPREYVEDVFEALLYGDHPLGRPVLGTEETVGAIPRTELLSYVDQLYGPGRLVVGIAGRLDFDARGEVERLLGDLESTNSQVEALPSPPAPDRVVLIDPRDSEQAYFCLGAPTYPLGHPDAYVLRIIATLLGTGMSSRLSDELVSKRALAYFVFAMSEGYADCGAIWAQTGVDVKRIDDAVRTVARELLRLTQEPVPAEELEKARNVAKGRFAFQLETPDGLLRFALRREVIEGRTVEPQEVLDGLDAVTADDVLRVAAEVLAPDRLRLAVVGPFEDETRFENLLD